MTTLGDKVSDGITEINKVLDSALSLAQSKKEFIGKQVINTFLLLIILLVFGCLDFATLKFHFEYLATVSYWTTVGSKVIAGVCAYNIGINLIWETELKKDAILKAAIELYNKLILYKQIDFEYFVEHIFNIELKKRAYKNLINKKIHILNLFSRPKDRLLYSSVIPENTENYEQECALLEAKKKKNFYCRKRQELEDLKKDEYINKNIDNIKVRYTAVDPSVFDLEIDGSAKSEGVKVKGNITVGKVKSSANVVLGMLGFSMFLTSISLDVNQEQFSDQMVAFWHYALKCAADVGVVLWQLIRGMLATRKIISNEITMVYVGRNKVLKSYIDWRLTTNQPTSKVDEEIQRTNEADVVEITQEEFDKLKAS